MHQQQEFDSTGPNSAERALLFANKAMGLGNLIKFLLESSLRTSHSEQMYKSFVLHLHMSIIGPFHLKTELDFLKAQQCHFVLPPLVIDNVGLLEKPHTQSKAHRCFCMGLFTLIIIILKQR